MWELDYKESWAAKNWCFWTMVLEKTLESPLDCKQTQPVHPKGDQSWVFLGRNDAKAETPILRPPHAKVFEKTLMLGGVGGRRKRGRQRMRCLDGITDGHESEWTPGVGDGQGGLACCNSWGHKESDITEWLNCTELNLFFSDPKAKNGFYIFKWLKKYWQIFNDLKINEIQFSVSIVFLEYSHTHSSMAASLLQWQGW